METTTHTPYLGRIAPVRQPHLSLRAQSLLGASRFRGHLLSNNNLACMLLLFHPKNMTALGQTQCSFG